MGLFAVFRSRKMAVLFLLGFSSGVPLLFSGQILQAWLTDEHVDLDRIAQFSWLGLFYTFKFVWAPLLDRFQLPFLGRRRGWILTFQVLLIAATVAMGTADPSRNLGVVAYFTLALTVFGASQDIVLDAYMVDVLEPGERAAGSSINVIGYRIASITSSGVAFWLSDYISYRAVWIVMAMFMLVGIAGTLLAGEPAVRPPRTFRDALVVPFADFWRRFGAGMLVVIAFAMTYRFGDYFAQTLLIKFLKGVVKFSGAELAIVLKGIGIVALVTGGILGGALASRYGLRRMLLVFGACSALTHLAYVLLALRGHDVVVFGLAIAIDYGVTAMAVSTFVAYFMSACSPSVSATQFAILTSLSSVGQRVFGGLAAAQVVEAAGWPGSSRSARRSCCPGSRS